MLIPLKSDEFNKYADYAYELTQDLTKSCFPIYKDGIKTKEDFLKTAKETFDSDNREILLFILDGKVNGWINYYVLSADKYISFNSFSIQSETPKAINEFIEYISQKYAGFTVYFGLPTDNISAISHLKKIGAELLEESYVDIMFFKKYNIDSKIKKCVRVNMNNFSDFEGLHKIHDSEMYWNCTRLLEHLNEWNILMLYENREAVGAIYYCIYENSMMEIFGVDFSDGTFNEDIYEILLTNALNDGKARKIKSLTYFTDCNEHLLTQKAGFECICKYVLYTKKT